MRGSSRAAILLPSLLAVALLLSGCGGAKAKAPPPDPYIQPKGFTDVTGSVKGYVVDEEFQPLKDAVVGFIDPYQATKTNEAGEFEIGQLQPAQRNLYVIHLGHKSAGKKIEIFAQQETIVTFVLPVLPVEEPWIDIVQRVGKFEKAFRIDPIGYSFNTSTSNPWRLKDDQKVLNGLHMDVAWYQSQSFAGGMRANLKINRESKAVFFDLEGRSPLKGTIDRAGIESTFSKASRVCVKELCRLEWTATPNTNMTNLLVDVGIMMEQNFEVWVSHAYRLEFAPGYTALP